VTDVTLTARVTDRAGNATSASRSVAVKPPPVLRKSGYGLNLYDAYNLFRQRPDEFKRDLALACDISPGMFFRFSLHMGLFMDPVSDTPYWKNMDVFMDLLHGAGVKPLPHPAMVTPFASPNGQNAWTYPKNNQIWGDAIHAWFSRYSWVKHLELGNEVNWGPFTSGAPSAAKYVNSLLLSCANALKGMGITMSHGSLVFNDGSGPVNFNELLWLRNVYTELNKAGHKNLASTGVTAMGVHPYAYRDSSVPGVFTRMQAVVDLCKTHGDDVELWATEWGATEAWQDYTQDSQAAAIEAFLVEWPRHPWAAIATIFMLRNAWHDGEDIRAQHLGVHQVDYTPKKAAAVVRKHMK
jgi:hypothetical protein